MKERACNLIEEFGHYKQLNTNTITIITNKICDLLKDKDLPVRVAASLSAAVLISHPIVKELLLPHISHLLVIYIKLINDIDLEEILESLSSILSTFSVAVKEYAIELTEQMVNVYKRLMTNEEGEENVEGSVVADGVLRAIITLIELFVNYPDIYPSLEKLIDPIIRHGLSSQGHEKFETTLDVIYAIVKNANKISENAWNYYIDIIDNLVGTDEEYAEFKAQYPQSEYEGLGFDSIDEVMPVLALYIAK